MTPEAFRAGEFFRQGPASALVIEPEGRPVPAELIPPAAWCFDASKITTTEMRPLLHLVGQYYDFRYKDWQWFAKRYNMALDDTNPDGLNVAWYHRSMSDHMKKRTGLGVSDLRYWVSIRRPSAFPEPMPAAAAETPMAEEELLDNPLTNEAPEAVVMGADAAVTEETETSDEPAPEAPPAEQEKVEEAAGTMEVQ